MSEEDQERAAQRARGAMMASPWTMMREIELHDERGRRRRRGHRGPVGYLEYLLAKMRRDRG